MLQMLCVDGLVSGHLDVKDCSFSRALWRDNTSMALLDIPACSLMGKWLEQWGCIKGRVKWGGGGDKGDGKGDRG